MLSSALNADETAFPSSTSRKSKSAASVSFSEWQRATQRAVHDMSSYHVDATADEDLEEPEPDGADTSGQRVGGGGDENDDSHQDSAGRRRTDREDEEDEEGPLRDVNMQSEANTTSGQNQPNGRKYVSVISKHFSNLIQCRYSCGGNPRANSGVSHEP